jgi:hypothetical protein
VARVGRVRPIGNQWDEGEGNDPPPQGGSRFSLKIYVVYGILH